MCTCCRESKDTHNKSLSQSLTQNSFAMYLIFMFVSLACAKTIALRNGHQLDEIFPGDYDKYEPPFTIDSPAHVYVRISIMDIDNINDGEMEFSIHSYIVELWKDYRLNLSSFQERALTNPNFPPYLVQYMWLPDLVFDNTKSGKLFQLSIPNVSVKVLKDGTLFRTSRYNLVVGCRMNFRFYPMDTQECFLKIATLANPDHRVLLHWSEELSTESMKSLFLVDDIQPLKYMLPDPKPYKFTEEWLSGNYTYLYANFTFIRRMTGSLFNVYVPSTLVVFLSWISFWLEIEAVPARVTLGVTSLLTLATQVVQAHVGLPPISYMTAMDVWLFACLFTVFSSLIEFAFSFHQSVLNKQKSTVDGYQEINQLKEDIAILKPRLSQNPLTRASSRAKQDSNKGTFKKLCKITRQKSLDKISRIAFPFMFSVFAIIYWTYYLFLK